MAKGPVVEASITIRSRKAGVHVVTNGTLEFTTERSQRKLIKRLREAADLIQKYLDQKTAERKTVPLGRRRPPPRRRPSAAVVN
jgi:hypothetical protein